MMLKPASIPALIVFLAICPSTLAQTAAIPPTLSLAQAEALALKNHPRIAVSENLAGAAGQRVVETRSAYYPTVTGEVTGSQGYDLSRIGAGTLTSSLLFNRFGAGLAINQLVTDLGRTHNLVASSRLEAQAADQNTQTARSDILLGVNRAYFGVLQAQAFVTVAQQTAKARQTVAEQIGALAAAQLKSQIDVSFAQVNVEEARLLLIRANDGVKQAFADLERVMGEDSPVDYSLSDSAPSELLPPDAESLIPGAVQNRPELRGLSLRLEASRKFEEAERDLSRPNITFVGVGGALPYLNQTPRVTPKEYEGVAVNLEIPIFNGHLYSARRQAAAFEATAADQRLRDEKQQVERDVRTAWLAASNAYQRIPVAGQLLTQAQLSLDLAQGRYNLGLASIVEITQAQLNVTQAQIEGVNARFEYQSAFAYLQYTVGNLR